MIQRAGSEQIHSQQRSSLKVKHPGSFLPGEPQDLARSLCLRKPTYIDDAHRCQSEGMRYLNRLTIVNLESSPQRLVPPDNLANSFFKRGNRERSD